MREDSPNQGPSSVVAPQENTRWDKAKAETVGRATYEVAEDVGYRATVGFDDNPFETSYLDIRKQDDDIAKLGQPFERLYDLNPEGFAQIPLPEFISVAKEFAELEWQLARREQELKMIRALLSSLQDNMVKRKPYYEGNDGDQFAREVMSIFHQDTSVTGEGFSSLRLTMKEFSKNFDLSPKQVLEKYIEFATKYVEIAVSRTEEAKKERQLFLEKHKIPGEVSEVMPV